MVKVPKETASTLLPQLAGKVGDADIWRLVRSVNLERCDDEVFLQVS